MTPVVRRFELALPDTLQACQQALADGPDIKLVAGGTDLLPQMKTGMVTVRKVVDLSALPELKLIEQQPDGALRVGAAVAARTIERSPVIRDNFAALRDGRVALSCGLASATPSGGSEYNSDQLFDPRHRHVPRSQSRRVDRASACSCREGG